MSLQEHFSSEHAWRRGPGIADGADVEAAIFGLPNIPRGEKHDGYMSLDQAIDFVKKHQPNVLSRSRAVRDLRARVAALCDDSATPVKFFTAVGTPLDIYHGIDAFFEQGGHIATIDISLREKVTGKADVLLLASFDKDGAAVIDEKEMTDVAHKIAARLNASPLARAA